ncbi:hypothetical protein C0J52_27366, partial [Blattella germanica]
HDGRNKTSRLNDELEGPPELQSGAVFALNERRIYLICWTTEEFVSGVEEIVSSIHFTRGLKWEISGDGFLDTEGVRQMHVQSRPCVKTLQQNRYLTITARRHRSCLHDNCFLSLQPPQKFEFRGKLERPAPWLSGLRQRALVPGHETRAGSSLRGGRNFLVDFGQCMGLVPTQHREESGELRYVADFGYEYQLNGWGNRRANHTSSLHWLDEGSPPCLRTYYGFFFFVNKVSILTDFPSLVSKVPQGSMEGKNLPEDQQLHTN